MNINFKCPVCNSRTYNLFLKSRDYFFSREDFDIIKCNNCGFLITWPQPEAKKLDSYYKTEEYLSHGSQSKSIFSNIYFQVRKFAIRKKYRIIKHFSSKGSILDFGCGTGNFLQYCKTKSWDVTGVELNDNARKIAQNQNSIKCYKDYLELNNKNRKYVIITMWHVLEHIPGLKEILKELAGNLESDGKWIIALPNVKSWDAKFYKKYWAAYDLPRHLYHFSRENITQLMKMVGFKLVAIKPMRYDSYYVSMLSEKYKNKRLSFIRGMFFGMISNIKALKTGEYSSLIYIFEKNEN